MRRQRWWEVHPEAAALWDGGQRRSIYSTLMKSKEEYKWVCPFGHCWECTISHMVGTLKSRCPMCDGLKPGWGFICGHRYKWVSIFHDSDLCPACRAHQETVNWVEQRIQELEKCTPDLYRADFNSRVAYWRAGMNNPRGGVRNIVEEMQEAFKSYKPDISTIMDCIKLGRPHYILNRPYWAIPYAVAGGVDVQCTRDDSAEVMSSLEDGLRSIDIGGLPTKEVTVLLTRRIYKIVHDAQWSKARYIFREVRLPIAGPSGKRALRVDFAVLRPPPLPQIIIEVDSDAVGRSVGKLEYVRGLGAIAVQVVFGTGKLPVIAPGVQVIHLV